MNSIKLSLLLNGDAGYLGGGGQLPRKGNPTPLALTEYPHLAGMPVT